MPPPRYPLEAYGSVVLNAAGAGRVSLRPTSTRETWVVEGAAVSTSTNTLEPTCNVYNSTLSSKLGGTFTGSQDQIGLNVTVRGGAIIADWVGGDPGATAMISLTGYRVMTRS